MGTKYPGRTLSGYNSSPPSDDGSEVASNAISWDTHKTKLGDPLKTLIEGINTDLLVALDTSPRAVTGTNVQLTDYGKVIEITGAGTVTMLAASTYFAGFWVTVKNTHTAPVTLDGGGVATIDGDLTVSLAENESITIMLDSAEANYIVTGKINESIRFTSVYVGSQQTLGGNSLILFVATEDDVNSDFDTTAFRYIVPVTGKYRIMAKVNWSSIVAADQLNMDLRLNATPTYLSRQTNYAAGIEQTTQIMWVGQLTAADYVDLYCEDVTTAGAKIDAGVEDSVFQFELLS